MLEWPWATAAFCTETDTFGIFGASIPHSVGHVICAKQTEALYRKEKTLVVDFLQENSHKKLIGFLKK